MPGTRYFNMNSHVFVTKKDGRQLSFGFTDKFPGSIHSIEIAESVKEMGDSCTIIIPRNLAKYKGKTIRELLSEGDKVEVFLGYDTSISSEFTGYIKEIGGTAPIEIICDDEFYPLRKNKNNLSGTFKLKDLLDKIAPGYNAQCPDVLLGKVMFDRESSYQVLKQINESFGFFSFIKKGVLYTQFAYDVRGLSDPAKLGKEHTYYLCDQVVNGKRNYLANTRPGSNQLKYHHADAMNVRVEVTANRADGKKYKYSVGPKIKDASVSRMNFATGVSDDQVRQIAEMRYKALVFDGYRGSIKGYGIPLTKAGDALIITDFEYPERNGKYLIESVKIEYNESGISRENTLSFKI